MSACGKPDRRLAPRPLPAHLTSAFGLWLSSRAALPMWKTASLPSNEIGLRLRALAADIAGSGFEQVAAALDREIARRATAFIDGLEAYRRHPYRRSPAVFPVCWREGASRLLDCGGDPCAPVVLVVPSLINRYYVLDLLPEQSFVRHLARHGLRPLVVDWGEPQAAEYGLDLDAYVERLDRAFAAAGEAAGRPLAVVGYCMGGLLALALALRRRQQVSRLALLATPWDFHAQSPIEACLLGAFGDGLEGLGNTAVPVEAIQSLFFWFDPFLAQRKFARFAALDPQCDEARRFVALEDWINDGVPLPVAVARACLRSWYGDNAPARGEWRVAGRKVLPSRWRRPALVVIPGRDRIVPPAAAEPLATAFANADVLRPPLGHVGMMSAARAPQILWEPLAAWLAAPRLRPEPRPSRRS
jgi:polyhydroxyalkanoate synthase